ncbi:MAG: hypothetical protein IPG80_01425 [Anaerolineales bacterium]|uniref:hypothetical protein n=1 Tax=Candidatus Villigracilis vicinus TaxID=3140679 RepID=UPI003136E926|nr:hypothetical protein [Anaerolineales bacterium]
MELIKKNIVSIFILIVMSILVWGRLHWYGDLRLSIANGETHSYISASRAPLFSWKIFTGERMFTTSVLYKLANDTVACPSVAYSFPSSGTETPREISPCFDKIVLIQNLLAVFGWVILALAIIKRLNNGLIKFVAAITILLFGFTPQLAEWESALGPESLSFSLFSISLALAMELAFQLSEKEIPFKSFYEKALLTSWLIVLFLWTFVRDVQLYGILVTFGLVASLLFIKKVRVTIQFKIAAAVLLGIFILGYVSARDSFRAALPVINAIDEYIWPHPARVEFFKEYGMPDRDAPAYKEWADKYAFKAYGAFLATHPGFIVTTIWEYKDYFRSDFVQAYYPADDVKNRDILLLIGQIFHMENFSVYLLDLLLLLTLLIGAFQHQTIDKSAWAWLALWVFGIAAVTLLLSFLGDIYGTRRHVMPGVEWFRLFFWIFLMPVLDMSLNTGTKPKATA